MELTRRIPTAKFPALRCCQKQLTWTVRRGSINATLTHQGKCAFASCSRLFLLFAKAVCSRSGSLWVACNHMFLQVLHKDCLAEANKRRFCYRVSVCCKIIRSSNPARTGNVVGVCRPLLPAARSGGNDPAPTVGIRTKEKAAEIQAAWFEWLLSYLS